MLSLVPYFINVVAAAGSGIEVCQAFQFGSCAKMGTCSCSGLLMGPSLLCVRQKVPRLEVQGGQHLAKYRRQQPKKQNCFFFRFSGAIYTHFPFHLPGNVKTGNGKLGCAPPTPFFCPHARKISEAFAQRSGKKDGCDASTTVILTLGPLPFPLFRCTRVRPANSGFLDSRPSVGPTQPPSKRGERGFTVCNETDSATRPL